MSFEVLHAKGANCLDHGPVRAAARGGALRRLQVAARRGAPVVLLGRQGVEEITADELASWAGTISYEMLLAATARVPIVYQNEE